MSSIDKKSYKAWYISTIIEILIGSFAYLLSPKGTIIGFSAACITMILLMVSLRTLAKLAPNHYLLSRVYRNKPTASKKAFWNGRFGESYYHLIAERKSSLLSIFQDSWAIIVLALYAAFTPEPVISCALLGAASACSTVILLEHELGI